MTSWYERAWDYIAAEHEKMPADIDFRERKRWISAAYPWGERRMFPYKMWLKAQKEYLARHDPEPPGFLRLGGGGDAS